LQSPAVFVVAAVYLLLELATLRRGHGNKKGAAAAAPIPQRNNHFLLLVRIPPFDPCTMTATYCARDRATGLWPRATVIASNS
jgi:hypothetical protein